MSPKVKFQGFFNLIYAQGSLFRSWYRHCLFLHYKLAEQEGEDKMVCIVISAYSYQIMCKDS